MRKIDYKKCEFSYIMKDLHYLTVANNFSTLFSGPYLKSRMSRTSSLLVSVSDTAQRILQCFSKSFS